MTELLIKIIDCLKGFFSKELIVFIVSMLPVLELRAGLIASSLLKIPYLKAAIICIVGNILPVPLIIFFLNTIFSFMERWDLTAKIARFFKNMARKHKPAIDKYGFFGLVLFVGIPLPGTGAWTGALVSSVFHMDIKKSIFAILIGIIMAFIIMSILSYGILVNIVK